MSLFDAEKRPRLGSGKHSSVDCHLVRRRNTADAWSMAANQSQQSIDGINRSILNEQRQQSSSHCSMHCATQFLAR